MEEEIFFIGDEEGHSFKALDALNLLSHTLGDHPTILLEKIPEFDLDLFRRIKNSAIDEELFRDLAEDEPVWLVLIKPDQMTDYEPPRFKVMDLSVPGIEENSEDDKYHFEMTQRQDSTCPYFKFDLGKPDIRLHESKETRHCYSSSRAPQRA